MFRINCPWCGIRDHDEFTFGGELRAHAPAWDAPLTGEDLAAQLFMRDNLKGVRHERWLHTSCREWLRVVRDTADHSGVCEATHVRAP
ncbi:MAG TPA: sarcosine oxidase subunit delta [Steroidobacteraceae bacterium]|jgi:heterotetrameric sarcosine oxidase delta subunit|nr:sarcosine oxidase subunit delta [Steroidobacteraceae bacterium]